MTKLIKAVKQNDRGKVTKILGQGVNINEKDEKGGTALHYAVQLSATDILERLLTLKDISIDEPDSDDSTPLYYAIYFNKLAAVRMLLTQGADINKQGRYGKTPLQVAAGKHYPDVMKLLLEEQKVNIDLQNNHQRRTALHYAVQHNNEAGVNLLLEKNAQINLSDSNGNTPLHQAIYHARDNIAKILLAHGADVNAVNNNKNTALHNALSIKDSHSTDAHSTAKMIALLLQHGARVDLQNTDGDTSLHIIARNYNDTREDLFPLILNKNNVNLVNHRGETALHIIINNTLYYDRDTQKKLVLNLLAIEGINVNILDKDGETPLFRAIRHEQEEIVKALINHGANVNHVSKNSRMPLHYAADFGRSRILAQLLTAGAEVDTINYWGEAPLHVAARNGHIEIVTRLLAHKADITIKNNQQQTALDIARQNNRTEVVALLEGAAKKKVQEAVVEQSAKTTPLIREVKQENNGQAKSNLQAIPALQQRALDKWVLGVGGVLALIAAGALLIGIGALAGWGVMVGLLSFAAWWFPIALTVLSGVGLTVAAIYVGMEIADYLKQPKAEHELIQQPLQHKIANEQTKPAETEGIIEQASNYLSWLFSCSNRRDEDTLMANKTHRASLT